MTRKMDGDKIIMAIKAREPKGDRSAEAKPRKRKDGFAEAFYISREWRACAAAYRKRVIFCERCRARGIYEPGTQVHHKIHLTPENLTDPRIALDTANLQLLCDTCHEAEHGKHRLRADACGHVDLPPG